MSRRTVTRIFVLALVASSSAAAASDIVVARVGDGSAALSTAATAVFIERHTSDGTPVGAPLALPIAASGANQPFTLSGSVTSEGALAASADGRYVTLAGYAAVPGTSAVSASTSSSVNRVVARFDAQGNIDTSTRLDTAFSAASVRAAVSSDGSQFWVSGNGTSGGGVWYLPLGTTGGTQILAVPSNMRFVNIFANQLFGDSGSGSFVNVFTIGAGLPTAGGQTATSFPGMPTSGSSPYSFVLFDRSVAVAGLDTLYLADDRTAANGGGIQKWTFDGFTWTLGFTSNNFGGIRGLAGEVAGANIVLYATTTEASANNLLRLVDDGSPTPMATLIAMAPANTVYRGVSLAPLDIIFRNGFE